MSKRKDKKILCCIVVIIILIIMAMNYKAVETIKPIDIDTYEDITEGEMLDIFQNAYGLTSLEKQQLYWNEREQQVVLNFFFLSNMEEWHMDSAKKYGVNTFINKQLLSLGNPQLYQIWSYNHPISKVIIQIYKEGNLISQDVFENQD